MSALVTIVVSLLEQVLIGLAPVLIALMRELNTQVVEDGKAPDDLRTRLRDRVRRMRDEGGGGSNGRPGADTPRGES